MQAIVVVDHIDHIRMLDQIQEPYTELPPHTMVWVQCTSIDTACANVQSFVVDITAYHPVISVSFSSWYPFIFEIIIAEFVLW